MSLHDTDGTSVIKLHPIYDNNGSTHSQIQSMYDTDATASSLIYTIPTENKFIIYDGSTNSGWWATMGFYANNAYRCFIKPGTASSPSIDITPYTSITVSCFNSLQYGGSTRLIFAMRRTSDNVMDWALDSGTASFGNWQGQTVSGTYDISHLSGAHYIQIQTVGGGDYAHTYFGTSWFSYWTE